MKRRRRQPISAINVVPYLDVMLVLLVIFMITAPLFNQGVVDVPKVGEKPLPTAENAQLEIIYEQSAERPYRLRDRKDDTETERLNIGELTAELGKKAVLHEDPTIIVSADGALSYQEVMALLGRLRDAGYDNIALSARTEKT